jgi:phosphoglycerol transferase MdoB-like AlkP superfamily enzyme
MRKCLFKKLPSWVIPLLFIAKLYVLGILFFTIFRLLFFGIYFEQIIQIENNQWATLLSAFFMGWRFDTVISMYLLALPAIAVFFGFPFSKSRKFVINFAVGFSMIAYALAFLVCVADIPFYGQFGSRFNTMAFAWMDNPAFVFGMIFGEIRYWLYIVPLVLILFAWVKLLLKLKKRSLTLILEQNSLTYSLRTASMYSFSVLMTLAVMFLGMRGRIEKKSPIRIGTAFISNYNFPNQLGLNPNFTLLRSWLDDRNAENKPLSLIDDRLALKTMQQELGVEKPMPGESPIARAVVDSAQCQKPNVVLVIMESMSAEKMKKYGNGADLTPNLERLAPHAYFFNRIYTAGIHTNNGIYSTLYSYPALLKKHPMNQFPTPIYTGLPGILKQIGYRNTFFLTHDEQFDNMSGFLKANHFDKIVSQKDYPSKEVLSTLGVPDHYMFQYAITQELTKAPKTPFFAAFMTGSDHGPYIIPQNIPFKPKTSDIHTSIVEYADWAIGYFLDLAKKEPWFDNTIFVFVADHGYSGNSPYEVSLDYHHTPFIIYSPKYIPVGKEFDQVGLQVDVASTVLGFIHARYVNSTLGVDLLNRSRKYAVFSSDDKIGCLNDSLFSIIQPDGSQKMFLYKNRSSVDVSQKYKPIADDMKRYAYSYIQASQWLIQNHFTSSGIEK